VGFCDVSADIEKPHCLWGFSGFGFVLVCGFPHRGLIYFSYRIVVNLTDAVPDVYALIRVRNCRNPVTSWNQ